LTDTASAKRACKIILIDSKVIWFSSMAREGVRKVLGGREGCRGEERKGRRR